MLGGQWRGCQASVLLARVTRKENVRALSSLSSTSVSESRISSHVNNPINRINLREISNSSRIIQVRNLRHSFGIVINRMQKSHNGSIELLKYILFLGYSLF